MSGFSQQPPAAERVAEFDVRCEDFRDSHRLRAKKMISDPPALTVNLFEQAGQDPQSETGMKKNISPCQRFEFWLVKPEFAVVNC